MIIHYNVKLDEKGYTAFAREIPGIAKADRLEDLEANLADSLRINANQIAADYEGFEPPYWMIKYVEFIRASTNEQIRSNLRRFDGVFHEFVNYQKNEAGEFEVLFDKEIKEEE